MPEDVLDMERVVDVVRHLVDPHHHSDVHTPLVGPITITEKGVELACPIGLHVIQYGLERADMRNPVNIEDRDNKKLKSIARDGPGKEHH